MLEQERKIGAIARDLGAVGSVVDHIRSFRSKSSS